MLSSLQRLALPALGARPIDQIGAPEALAILRTVGSKIQGATGAHLFRYIVMSPDTLTEVRQRRLT